MLRGGTMHVLVLKRCLSEKWKLQKGPYIDIQMALVDQQLAQIKIAHKSGQMERGSAGDNVMS